MSVSPSLARSIALARFEIACNALTAKLALDLVSPAELYAEFDGKVAPARAEIDRHRAATTPLWP